MSHVTREKNDSLNGNGGSGAGRLAQWLRALIALTEDMIAVPSAHTVANNYL